MTKFYVYFYYESGNAHPFYIGKGSGYRAWSHLEPRNLKINTPFYSKLTSMLRAGIHPEVEIVSDNLSELEAFNQERFFIRKFGRLDLNSGCLYNCTEGGEGSSGAIRTDEFKEKVGEFSRGRKPSEATKEKISRSLMGHIGSNKRPVIAKWLNGVVYRRYDSLIQVREDGFSDGHISTVLKNKTAFAYDLVWEYENV